MESKGPQVNFTLLYSVLQKSQKPSETVEDLIKRATHLQLQEKKLKSIVTLTVI